MPLTDKQKNRLRRLKLVADEGEIGLIKELNAIEDRIDDALVEKADRGDLESVRESVLAEVGKMMEENEPEEPEVVEGPPGPKGDDYVLTEKDKEDIAKSINVPVVERIVEKTEVIHETPIVTENVVEVAVKDTPQETRNKLASLEGEERLDKSAIKGIDELEKYLSERIAQIRGGISGVARGIQLYISGVKKGLANTLNLKAGTNVTITHSYANGQNDITISATGGAGSGVVESVVAGTGISVDSTDPANPIVSSTVTQYTDEMAQDATGAMVDSTLVYVDATPLLTRAALAGAITATQGSNTTALGSFNLSQLNTALSDADVATGGGTATGTNTGDQTSIVGITGTKAQFNTALTDSNFLFVGDVVSGYIVETPSGTVDGSNVTFTVGATPVYIVSDGATLFENFGYTLSTLTVTMDNAPNQFIRSFHS